MRILFAIVIIFILLGAIVFIWVTRTWKKITFSPPKLSEALQGLTLATISGQTVSLPLTIHIKNDSNSSIPFSNINAKLYYNGIMIAETNDTNSHILPANSSFDLTQNVNIDLTIAKPAAQALLIAKLNGQHPTLEYEIHPSVFGIPLDKIPFFLPIKDTFTW